VIAKCRERIGWKEPSSPVDVFQLTLGAYTEGVGTLKRIDTKDLGGGVEMNWLLTKECRWNTKGNADDRK
jgi:hypothetical protein